MTAPVPTDDDLAATNAVLDALMEHVTALTPRVSDAETAIADLLVRVQKLETAPLIVPQPVWPILGRDDIQAGALPVTFPGTGAGFGWCLCEHPIGTNVQPSDANGANLSIVPDPLGGTFKVLRHLISLRDLGSRAQAGWTGSYAAFNTQAKRQEGIWIAVRMYFPAAFSAGNHPVPWLSISDWHSLDPNQGTRLHTNPGTFLAKDGSMRFYHEWGPLWQINQPSALSTIPLPVGRWFQFEQHRTQSVNKDVTIETWIDGQLALSQSGVQTTIASNLNGNIEWYNKFYGSNSTGTPWTPEPGLKFSYDARFGSGRLTQA